MVNHQRRCREGNRLLRLLLLCAVAGFVTVSVRAQAPIGELSKREDATPKVTHKRNYWYVGAELFSPFMYDDLYSWTRGTNGKFHFGAGFQLRGGYQFTSVFGLELALGLGGNRLSPSEFQYEYYLGKYNAYTFYPYTQVDGQTYTLPFPGLVGEQGNNLGRIEVDATQFRYIQSRVNFTQFSLSAVVNMNRLFHPGYYTEQPVELLLRPGLYLSNFRSKVVDTRTGEVVAPRINRSLTWGVGTDLSLRFNLHPSWAFDLSARLVWERDHAMDGIENIKRAYDAYMIQPAVGVVYKLRSKAIAPVVPITPVLIPAPAPSVESATPIEPADKIAEPVFPQLSWGQPAVMLWGRVKQRSHTAAIYLTYPVNKTHIERSLHQNSMELERLEAELDSYIGNPDYTVRRIRVEGFASPEGSYTSNMRLAQGRAASIIDYIISRKPMLQRSLFQTGRMTENWAGLRDTLQRNLALPGSEAFLKLMDAEANTEHLKQRMKLLPHYDYLLNNVYPRLRLSSYTVEYDVRSYSINEAFQIIERNPELLSAAEMYAVAVKQGLDTPKGKYALVALEKYYPTSADFLLHKGYSLLNQGRYEQALATLNQVGSQNLDALNMLGVAHAYMGQLDEAMRCFEQAAVSLGDAQQNLNLLQNYLREKKR